MGFKHYRSVTLGKDVGMSFPASGVRISAQLPGSGFPGNGNASGGPSLPDPSTPRIASSRSRSVLGRRYHRAFARALSALARGDAMAAVKQLEQASAKGGASRASVQLFAALSLIELHRLPEAAAQLRLVVAADAPLPDRLMRKHLSGGRLEVHVTPNVTAHVAMDRAGAALLLAEVLQHAGRSEAAIELLETLGARTRAACIALALADLYLARGAWDEVERVTEEFPFNVDDLSLQILVLRARAQRERGAFLPTLITLREALRFRNRDPLLLNGARYERALTYESKGKRALARKDLERIFDQEPGFRDVAQRLSGSPMALTDFHLELLPSDAG